ncbi:Casein kinase I, putative [Trichomonas vaginalis G3]|uniref:Casein kinase I, putative n=1 Tax=Trichomonas vaginalis (strain ATCC PRA-98 / G3) TaxID=412133 RepID=A2DHL4_TRIV3|nr:protein kinase protein [Trichomonas vaginalis G3]EAY20062.1 Casein kinase I, putative [Trichomonas vaginalis G3]KAI5528014.1 protein kinase protein [Trichomonas vaginalis G3]|eukprot:XP_001581048.1 Casein kinase I [Trichomonas vaginalis G3]
MIGNSRSPHTLALIDFGLSTSFCDIITKIHIPLREGKSLVGTTRSASINVHNGIEYSRRDDMESLAYILIYFMKGSLPWQNVPLINGQSLSTAVSEIKQSTPIEELCYDLPEEFGMFLQEVRALQFEEEPNYVKYREMVRNLFIKSGFVYNYKFDWEGHENDKAPEKEVHMLPLKNHYRSTKSRDSSLSNSYWDLSHNGGKKKHHHNPFRPQTLLQMSALNLLTLK